MVDYATYFVVSNSGIGFALKDVRPFLNDYTVFIGGGSCNNFCANPEGFIAPGEITLQFFFSCTESRGYGSWGLVITYACGLIFFSHVAFAMAVLFSHSRDTERKGPDMISCLAFDVADVSSTSGYYSVMPWPSDIQTSRPWINEGLKFGDK